MGVFEKQVRIVEELQDGLLDIIAADRHRGAGRVTFGASGVTKEEVEALAVAIDKLAVMLHLQEEDLMESPPILKAAP